MDDWSNLGLSESHLNNLSVLFPSRNRYQHPKKHIERYVQLKNHLIFVTYFKDYKILFGRPSKAHPNQNMTSLFHIDDKAIKLNSPKRTKIKSPAERNIYVNSDLLEPWMYGAEKVLEHTCIRQIFGGVYIREYIRGIRVSKIWRRIYTRIYTRISDTRIRMGEHYNLTK